MGQHIVRTYALPTETARFDMTTASGYHQPAPEDGLMRFGHSKDHRPDLRQFKVALGTLDPVGLSLATVPLSGEQADDPHYLPVWDRLAATIGRPDFLVVGDCKLASLANRAHIQAHGGVSDDEYTTNEHGKLRPRKGVESTISQYPAVLPSLKVPTYDVFGARYRFISVGSLITNSALS